MRSPVGRDHNSLGQDRIGLSPNGFQKVTKRRKRMRIERVAACLSARAPHVVVHNSCKFAAYVHIHIPTLNAQLKVKFIIMKSDNANGDIDFVCQWNGSICRKWPANFQYTDNDR